MCKTYASKSRVHANKISQKSNVPINANVAKRHSSRFMTLIFGARIPSLKKGKHSNVKMDPFYYCAYAHRKQLHQPVKKQILQLYLHLKRNCHALSIPKDGWVFLLLFFCFFFFFLQENKIVVMDNKIVTMWCDGKIFQVTCVCTKGHEWNQHSAFYTHG